jgi:3-deoxy-D-manno-octulosonate 8-phosphate phosphatase (KDO 8-P phosphatase)
MDRFKRIKIVAIDVDGTLTDGKYYISNKGEVSKSFYTRDFYAIEKLLRIGIEVIIITQSHDDVIQSQLHRIASHSDFWRNSIVTGSLILFLSCNNKKKTLEEHINEHGLEWGDVAFMGDAENDLECLDCAGISSVPSDCVESIEDVDYRCISRGGQGSVYEFINYLLEKRGSI